jgi:NADH-quinone oxidoreductase subunit I
MFGLGVIKGLTITLKHFFDSYAEDVKEVYFSRGGEKPGVFARRQGPQGEGMFTVQYPEQKLKTPENFRFLPFLVTDYDIKRDSPDYERAKAMDQNRCTSCGICAKVCPPQCIWIVRTDDPKTGKPIPQPAEFYIDTDICMNCGYCAEFCPFDAIKMDHDYELADFEREVGHVHDIDRLLKPISYYDSIRPTWNAKEEATRRAAEEEKERKAAEKAAERAAAAATAAAAPVAPAVEAVEAAPKRSPEEIKAQREAMLAKRQGQDGGAETPADTPSAEAAPKRSPEEIKAQREAMMAKRAQKAAGILPEGETTPTPAVEAAPAAPVAEPAPVVAVTKTFTPATHSSLAAAAEATSQPKRSKASGKDDLKIVEGIGPKIERLLHAAGITTFAQLAAAPVERLDEILREANLRNIADPGTWPEQAKLLAAGDMDAFNKLTEELKGGRRVE